MLKATNIIYGRRFVLACDRLAVNRAVTAEAAAIGRVHRALGGVLSSGRKDHRRRLTVQQLTGARRAPGAYRASPAAVIPSSSKDEDPVEPPLDAAGRSPAPADTTHRLSG